MRLRLTPGTVHGMSHTAVLTVTYSDSFLPSTVKPRRRADHSPLVQGHRPQEDIAMSKRLTRAIKAAGLSVLAVVVTTSGLSATHSVAQAARPQATATYTIGLSLPYLQLKELADGIQRGVAVAVGQANARHVVRGVTFKIRRL